MPRKCSYPKCERPAWKGRTTCARHYTAGNTTKFDKRLEKKKKPFKTKFVKEMEEKWGKALNDDTLLKSLNEVDLETEKTLYRNIGYWDGKADREMNQSPGHTRWAKAYVYRALEPFKKSYWDGYWAGYYDKTYNALFKEDAPINNVGGGNIAGIGVPHPDKPSMWGEPGKDNKRKYKLMLMKMLGRNKPI